MFLINDHDTKVFEFHVFTEQTMGSYDDIDLTVRYFGQCFFDLLAGFKAVDIINRTGEVF
ncbi:hypothetical protein D3C86_1946950 [compost metagenome]